MNILYLFAFYRIGDGGSSAVRAIYLADKGFAENQLIVCKRIVSSEGDMNMVEDSDIETVRDFLSKGNLIIHYIRSNQSNILNRVNRLAKMHIPTITTVCQSPSYKRLMLSPYEIRKTNHFVFIDKASHNDPFISFIIKQHTSQMYLISKKGYESRIKETADLIKLEDDKNNAIIFGRGTTISKCPRDMFDVFDNINIVNKHFLIIGIPEGDNWVRKEAAKRNNVTVLPLLSYNKWVEKCLSMDIVLYELPVNNYASIDANLGLAMLLQKPVVYYGPDAPKERLHHLVNGYIANSPKEISQYAKKLADNPDLRRKIGEEARRSTISFMEENCFDDRMHSLYHSLNLVTLSQKVPLSYSIKYLRYCYKDILRNIFNKYVY